MIHGDSEEIHWGKPTEHLFDISSLVDLKAELFKKQEALKLARLNIPNESSKLRPVKLKGDQPKKCQKQAVRPQHSVEEGGDEQDLALKKSRLALEAKSKLYEQIISKKTKIGEAEEENYLVNFHKKVIENEKNLKTTLKTNGIENVNIDQSSGRVPYQERSTEKSVQDINEPNRPNQEELSMGDEYIHYQNVQFNEVRDHGVGYFAFSKDEEQRKEQMDSLNSLHNQTNKRRKCHNEKLEKKKLSLQSRLAKICQRRNIDKNVISNYITEPDTNDSTVGVSEAVHDDVSSIPLPEDNIPEKKPVRVRPWDIGKQSDGVLNSNIQKITKVGEDSWIENKRSERIEEFRPPDEYQRHFCE